MSTSALGPVISLDQLSELRIDSKLRLIDARKPEDYAAGHLLGAINVDLFDLHWFDSSPDGQQGFRQQHAAALGAAGVSREDTVVFYDDQSGMLAARGVWALEVLGQAAVAMLDGGLKFAQQQGWTLTTEPTALPVTDYQSEWHPESLAGWADTQAAITQSGVDLLDTRTPEEHSGEKVRAKFGGAIPSACHLDYQSNIGPDGRFKSATKLREQYLALGLNPERPVITYCQGGYRAANTYIALRLAGFKNVRNYFTSWGEWGNRDDLPKVSKAG